MLSVLTLDAAFHDEVHFSRLFLQLRELQTRALGAGYTLVVHVTAIAGKRLFEMTYQMRLILNKAKSVSIS